MIIYRNIKWFTNKLYISNGIIRYNAGLSAERTVVRHSCDCPRGQYITALLV